MPTNKRKDHQDLWVGAALILFGAVLLLDRVDLIELGRISSKWYLLIPIVFGFVRVVTWQSAERVSSGISWILFGLWIWASIEQWYGLTWWTSWPLALVAIGAGMVVKALPIFGEDKTAREPANGERHAG